MGFDQALGLKVRRLDGRRVLDPHYLSALRTVAVLAWLTERAASTERRLMFMNRLPGAMIRASYLGATRAQVDAAVIYGLELSGFVINHAVAGVGVSVQNGVPRISLRLA